MRIGKIIEAVEPTYHNNCQCETYLGPIVSWEDILRRHATLEHSFTRTLTAVTDTSLDWSADLFRCRECGRYWACEDVGLPLLTRSMPFFYHVDTNNPERWIADVDKNRRLTLDQLEKDAFYRQHIRPALQLDR